MSLSSKLTSALHRLPGYLKLRWQYRPDGLYCFNYHRVGDPDASMFDPNAFSCTQEQFAHQVAFFKKEFDMVSAEEISRITRGNETAKGRLAWITFDDGYLDNYELAFPVLKEHGINAAFYVVTDYLDNPSIPWWDQIAWMIKKSKKTTLEISGHTIPLADMPIAIRDVLRVVKKSGDDISSQLALVREVTDVEDELPEANNLLMSWEHVQELDRAGMHIGSHSVSHRILSSLSFEEQQNELVNSKTRIESMLGHEVASLAYPVGGGYTFSNDTMQVAKDAGYDFAMSFESGINRGFGDQTRYQLRRVPVDGNASVRTITSLVCRAPSFG